MLLGEQGISLLMVIGNRHITIRSLNSIMVCWVSGPPPPGAFSLEPVIFYHLCVSMPLVYNAQALLTLCGEKRNGL